MKKSNSLKIINLINISVNAIFILLMIFVASQNTYALLTLAFFSVPVLVVSAIVSFIFNIVQQDKISRGLDTTLAVISFVLSVIWLGFAWYSLSNIGI